MRKVKIILLNNNIVFNKSKMVDVKYYRVIGKFKDRLGNLHKFDLIVKGTKKEDVLEKIYSNIGGNHKVKRIMIKIEKIEEINLE